ncbi:MAG: molybdopterin molybdotransferase MoeA [Cyclobacteriaceae bacterium]
MISVAEALEIVTTKARDFGMTSIPLSDGIGRVLREDISADRDMPPYDRVTMDGIAIQYKDYEQGVKTFHVVGVAAAGAEQMTLTVSGECLEVMTGAIVPKGLDTVIPYEEINIEDQRATINEKPLTKLQNIHFKGFDRKTGDVVIKSGQILSSTEIGVCATVGKSKVKVSRLPKTVIISTGDELVEIDEQPLAHQIRKSNIYRLKTALSHYGATVDMAHLDDEYDTIIDKLRTILNDYELVILSGGVSKGKFDFLPQALEELGVEKHFHRISQRPGKPFWFGSFQDQSTVFAFPGNPVSSFMCMQRYFKTWLNHSLQISHINSPYAVLGADVHFKPNLTYFLEVKLNFSPTGEIVAMPVKGNGSGDLANLVDADAFVELPMGRDDFHKGEKYPILTYRESLI